MEGEEGEKVAFSKYHKLLTEYSKLKQGNIILKKGILEEKEKSSCFCEEGKNLKERITTLSGNNSNLLDQNQRLSKRISTLQNELEQSPSNIDKKNDFSKGHKKNNKSTGDLKDQAITLFNTATGKRALAEKEAEIGTLQDELRARIEECQSLHLKVVSLTEEHDETLDMLKGKLARQKINLSELESKCSLLEESLSQRTADCSSLNSTVESLKKELSSSRSDAELALEKAASSSRSATALQHLAGPMAWDNFNVDSQESGKMFAQIDPFPEENQSFSGEREFYLCEESVLRAGTSVEKVINAAADFAECYSRALGVATGVGGGNNTGGVCAMSKVNVVVRDLTSGRKMREDWEIEARVMKQAAASLHEVCQKSFSGGVAALKQIDENNGDFLSRAADAIDSFLEERLKASSYRSVALDETTPKPTDDGKSPLEGGDAAARARDAIALEALRNLDDSWNRSLKSLSSSLRSLSLSFSKSQSLLSGSFPVTPLSLMQSRFASISIIASAFDPVEIKTAEKCYRTLASQFGAKFVTTVGSLPIPSSSGKLPSPVSLLGDALDSVNSTLRECSAACSTVLGDIEALRACVTDCSERVGISNEDDYSVPEIPSPTSKASHFLRSIGFRSITRESDFDVLKREHEDLLTAFKQKVQDEEDEREARIRKKEERERQKEIKRKERQRKKKEQEKARSEFHMSDAEWASKSLRMEETIRDKQLTLDAEMIVQEGLRKQIFELKKQIASLSVESVGLPEPPASVQPVLDQNDQPPSKGIWGTNLGVHYSATVTKQKDSSLDGDVVVGPSIPDGFGSSVREREVWGMWEGTFTAQEKVLASYLLRLRDLEGVVQELEKVRKKAEAEGLSWRRQSERNEGEAQEEREKRESLAREAKHHTDMLSEHIAEMSIKIGAYEDQCSEMRASRVFCSRCRKWNEVGWLVDNGMNGRRCSGGKHPSGYNFK